MAGVIRLGMLAAVAAGMVACAAQPAEGQSGGALPAWVAAPVVDGGLADTQCVENNASYSVIQGRATALARAELARQVGVRVQAMDRTFQDFSDSGEAARSGATFESVSRQVTNEKLAGSRPVRVEFVDFPGGEQMLCVMVEVPPETTREVYSEVVARSGRDVDADQDAILWQEFKAHRTQQSMEAELERYGSR